MDLVSSLLQSVNSQVQQAVRQNLSLDDTRQKVDVASFEKQFAGDNPNRRRNFGGLFSGHGRRAGVQGSQGTLDTQ